MSIRITCGECGEEFSLKDTAAGKKFTCKVCGAAIHVPDVYEVSEDDVTLDEVPDRPSEHRGRSRHDEAASRCLLPAIFLYVVCALSLVNHAAAIVMAYQGVNLNPFVKQENMAPEMVQTNRIAGMVGGVIGMAIDFIVLAGAYCLQRVQGHGMAMTGAIVACIPLCSPCTVLGIPFGIWALVVLNNSDVRAAFRSRATANRD